MQVRADHLYLLLYLQVLIRVVLTIDSRSPPILLIILLLLVAGRTFTMLFGCTSAYGTAPRSRCWTIFGFLLLDLLFSVSGQACANDDSSTMQLSEEKRLIKKLLSNYHNAGIIGRPVQNTSDKVVVEYGLGLIQILDLDEKNQVLTINVWSRYQWTDQLLRWDPKNYSNVEIVRVPPSKIWTPDIVLYNYADERLKEQRDVMAVVSHTGKVMWIPPAIYKSTCKIDIKNFPFDQQSCHLKFGSWTYDGFKLDIQFYKNLSAVSTADYTTSNEWVIMARPAVRNVKFYPCCVEPYPDLTFFLILRRNPAFYTYLLVLPCVLLSSLTLVIFWLPPESPAKMVLGMNIFVAFFLLLLLLSDSTPSAASSVPYIGFYYCVNMVLITMSTFLSVIVINLYFRGDKRNKIPCWLKKVVQIVAQMLCMQHEMAHEDVEKLRVIKSEIKHYRHHKAKQARKSKACTTEVRAYPITPYSEVYFGGGLTTTGDYSSDTGGGGGHSNSGTNLRPTPFSMGQPLDVYSSGGGGGHLNRSMRGSGSGEQNVGSPEKSPTFDRRSHKNIESDLREIRRALRVVLTRLTEKDTNNKIAREWRMVALVLDRIFFWSFFTVIIVMGLVLLLPKEPTQTIDEIIEQFRPKSVQTGTTAEPILSSTTTRSSSFFSDTDYETK